MSCLHYRHVYVTRWFVSWDVLWGQRSGARQVDRISGSRHQNMKELRYRTLRALFIIDPARRAIVLLGGDKRGDWTGWYERTIPQADELYDNYLRSEDAP